MKTPFEFKFTHVHDGTHISTFTTWKYVNNHLNSFSNFFNWVRGGAVQIKYNYLQLCYIAFNYCHQNCRSIFIFMCNAYMSFFDADFFDI